MSLHPSAAGRAHFCSAHIHGSVQRGGRGSDASSDLRAEPLFRATRGICLVRHHGLSHGERRACDQLRTGAALRGEEGRRGRNRPDATSKPGFLCAPNATILPIL